MTLRAYFMLMGCATFLPALFFLVMHRRGNGPKWISRALRALAIIPLVDGFRLMMSSIKRIESAPEFIDNWDRATSVLSITFATCATWFFFAVYINVRRWWDK